VDFHYRVLDYKEKSLAEIPFTGLSADYVYRETKRARPVSRYEDAVWAESTLISQRRRIIASAVRRGRGCGSGRVHGGCGRCDSVTKYSEMKLENLKGAWWRCSSLA